jgi:hypothetical protein
LVVEAVLVPGLVSSGLPLPGAISAMLIYRLISWLFLAAVGWVVFFFMFRAENDADALEESATDTAAEPASDAESDGAALQGPLPPPDPTADGPSATRERTT